MNQTRIERVLGALKDMGVSQMLITDPMSIYYLTDVYVHPGERFYALYLREDGKHIFFLNKLPIKVITNAIGKENNIIYK